VNLSLPPEMTAAQTDVWECTQFHSGWSWGAVVTADFQISGETASALPVNLIGSQLTPPQGCASGTELTSPQQAGVNGFLGLGVFQYDCGTACVTIPEPDLYYSCPPPGGSNCIGITQPLSGQLQNPIPLFTTDNNGFIITMPSISDTGATGVTGTLTFGIDTESNNALNGAVIFTPSPTSGQLIAAISSASAFAILDTGTASIAFLDSPTTGLQQCGSIYCPSSPQIFGATIEGGNGALYNFNFTIANVQDSTQVTQGSDAIDDYGSPFPNFFDFGMPFFYGRTVYFAIQGQTNSGGTGPFWAF